jgi:hypothetical protein
MELLAWTVDEIARRRIRALVDREIKAESES